METARKNIADALATACTPAVLFSGGKDSLLLLALAREVRDDITAIWFRTGELDKHTRRVVKDWNVTTLSWAPADVYLLAQAGERVLVQEYDFGGVPFPVITDLAPGTTCSRLLPPLTPTMFPGFDVVLWGAKDTDTHWLKGTASFPPDGHPLGFSRLYAPLRHMTDEGVAEALAALNIPYTAPADSLPMCSACMETDGEVDCPLLGHRIPAVQTNWAAGLAAFRQRFQLEDANG